MITNGNHGTTVRSRSSARPGLTCPLFIEQRLRGRLVEERGVGAQVSVDKPETFADRVAKLVGDQEIPKNVSRFITDAESLLTGAAERAVERICSILG